jgi:uncharacterized protein YigE (DUF2233 family)
MKRLNLLLVSLLFLLAANYAAADERFTVVRVNPATEDLQIFWADERGHAFNGFDRLASWLQQKRKTLVFGTNAGMYHADYAPVGLLVLNGKQLFPLNLSDGSGNFFLKPNGVFLLSKKGPQVVETTQYTGLSDGVVFATQSGPLLLRNGVIHPSFNSASKSKLIRNGVGVVGGSAVFVISEKPVTFYELAVFFRDVLHCNDALYLDGVVSSLYSPRLQRNDRRASLGPIIGVVQPLSN